MNECCSCGDDQRSLGEEGFGRAISARRKLSFTGARKQGVTMRPMLRSLCVLFFLLLLLSAASVAQVGNTSRPAPTTRVIGILSAMTLEIETLGQQLTDKKEMTVEGIRFTTGSLKDRKVV